MDREVQIWVHSRERAMFIRNYVVPTIARLAIAAIGIGIGYIIGNM